MMRLRFRSFEPAALVKAARDQSRKYLTRPRQAALAMAVSVFAASAIASGPNVLDKDAARYSIQPRSDAVSRALALDLTFPHVSRQRDASLSVARREAQAVELGMASTVTVAQNPELDQAEKTETELPQTIVASEQRIERPRLRSQAGEPIRVAQADALPAMSPPLPAEPDAAPPPGPSVQPDIAGLAPDMAVALVEISDEAQARHTRASLSAQAMSEALSLYMLRARAEAIGAQLLRKPKEKAGGFWSASLSDNSQDILFQDGRAFGQSVFSSVAGYDLASTNVLASGDRLIYGGFASAFGTAGLADQVWTVPGADVTRGGAAGLYATYSQAGFDLTATLRADLAETGRQVAADRVDFSGAMRSMKAEVAARTQFDVAGINIEPSAGLSYTQASRSLVQPGQAGVRFEEAESFKAQASVKASAVVYNKGDFFVEPSVTINISREMIGQGDVTFLSGSPTGPSDPISGKTIGSVSVNVDVIDAGSGITGFLKADGQVSDDDKPKAGVSAGVRAEW
jgi:hypothetical protein